ncbi:uncharacterized protein JCM6883_006671 [Sporobolomyces salmoneus]|uniref:uncharacterized protein n=1 Tax=Sporobolomyces salmoneus TaxID=183962 RepID=UPI00316E7FE2
MGKRKNTPTKPVSSTTASTALVDDDQQQPPLSSPTFSTGDPGTETETEEDDSSMDTDGPSTATNSDNEQAEEEEKDSLPHSHETDPNRESPSTPTRSRSPSSALSNRLSTASIESPAGAESNDLLSPLSSTTTTIPSAASPSTYENPKRPFSLSSEPDTPTVPTPSTPSPKKKPLASSSSFSPSGTGPISPGLTQQVWRNSMGLPPSPVTNPASNGKLVDVNLSESTSSNLSRISTPLDYTPDEASTSSSTSNALTMRPHL